ASTGRLSRVVVTATLRPNDVGSSTSAGVLRPRKPSGNAIGVVVEVGADADEAVVVLVDFLPPLLQAAARSTTSAGAIARRESVAIMGAKPSFCEVRET